MTSEQPATAAGPVIGMVAGETSGDQLGAALMAALKQRHPNARFVGIGGDGMQAEGLERWWHCEELAVMGLAEVLIHLPRLLKLRRQLRQRLLDLKPDLFIGIDAPDFNLGLEKRMRRAGIRTVHYVSPTVWAWRQGRVRTIAAAADMVLCLFPFEPAFYANHGVTARYTGHPMADEIPLQVDRAAARARFGLAPTGPLIALLPGSRSGEVSRHAGPLLGAAAELTRRQPGVTFIAPMANARLRSLFETELANHPGLECHITNGQARAALAACDIALLASGTAALEAMLVNRPMVVIYRFSALTYFIGRRLKLLKSRFFSLPNILADEPLVAELEQHQANPMRIADEAMLWLQDAEACTRLQQRFNGLHTQLRNDAAIAAADAVGGLLNHGSDASAA